MYCRISYIYSIQSLCLKYISDAPITHYAGIGPVYLYIQIPSYTSQTSFNSACYAVWQKQLNPYKFLLFSLGFICTSTKTL